MPGFVLPPHPLRRLLAAVFALSVLLTTLGWVHPVCDARGGGDGSAASVVGHHATPGAPIQPDQHETCGGAAHRASGDRQDAERPSHEGHGEGQGRDVAGSDACALVAHCAAAVIATASDGPASRTLPVARPASSSDARHRGPSYQPASPPPKA